MIYSYKARHRKGNGLLLRYALFALSLLLSASAAADSLVVHISPGKCIQGLYKQPPGGPFSVFLFCDDALGSNLGVVDTAGGAGPGEIDLAPPKQWNKWAVNNRFWQDPTWATDVTSFAWSTNLKYLYVATSSTYGQGGLYKLDLVNRTYKQLLPRPGMSQSAKGSYESVIVRLSHKTGLLTVRSRFFDALSRKTKTQVTTLK